MMSEQDIFQELRKKVNQRGVGFDATTTGVELKILKRIFTEEEAQMFMHLSWDLESSKRIADRVGQPHDTILTVLKRMAEKGQVFPKRKGDVHYYAAVPYAHGLFEHQVNKMDPEIAQMFEEYLWAERIQGEDDPDRKIEPAMPLRVIPVKQPVNIERPTASYEDVQQIIEGQDRIAVAKCACALQKGAVDGSCEQPLEVCLLFGFYAEYYVEQGYGRWIDQEEAMKVIDIAEEAGLVHQPSNTVNPGAICNCCPDCCLSLRVTKLFPNAADLANSIHYCKVDGDECSGCEVCVEICPMDAVVMGEQDVAVIDTPRCIGCGLCVNACPDEILMLAEKPEETRHQPPEKGHFMRTSEEFESNMKA